MSGSVPQVTDTPYPQLVDDSQFSTATEQVPVPLLAGERLVAVTWITPVYGLKPVPNNSGKKGGGDKKGGGGADTYDYYGTVAGVVCFGQVLELIALLVDGGVAWPPARGPFVDGTTYSAGQIVYHEGIFYQTSTSTTATPPAAPWSRFFLSSSSANGDGYTTIAVPKAGNFRFYWGAADQSRDAYLADATKANIEHPSYARNCYIVAENCFLGRERPAAWNLQAIVRLAPGQTIVTGDAAGLEDGQANAIAWAAWLLTDPVTGSGLDATRLDDTSFQAAAEVLATAPDLTGISPILTGQSTIRGQASDVISVTDAWLRHNAASDKIEAGVWTHGVTPTDYVTLTIDHLVANPRITQQGWVSAKTAASVQFPDRERLYKDSVEAVGDQRARMATGEPRTQTLDRPAVTRRSQAHAQGAEWLRVSGSPQLTIELRVRRAFALGTAVSGDPFENGVRPGDWVRLDIDPEPGGVTTLQFARVTQRSIPRTGDITITCIADVTQTPMRYTPVPGYQLPDLATAPAMFPNYRLIECPPPLAGGKVANVLALVQRPATDDGHPEASVHVAAHLIYDSPFDSLSEFLRVGTQPFFCMRASLTVDLDSEAAGGVDELPDLNEDQLIDASVTASMTVDLNTPYTDGSIPPGWYVGATFTSGAETALVLDSTAPDVDGIVTLTLDTAVTVSASDSANLFARPLILAADQQVDAIWSQGQPGRSGATNDDLLLFLVSIDSGAVEESDGVAVLEVLSICGWTALDDGTHSIRALRGRRGTQRTSFVAANTEAWVIHRDGLRPIFVADFNRLRTQRRFDLTPDTAVFRLQPEDIRSVRRVEDCEPDISFQWPLNSLSVPQLTWIDPGNTSWPYVFGDSSGGNVRFVGQWKDADGNLTHAGLSYSRDGGAEVFVDSVKLVDAGEYTFDRTVSFTDPGTYTVFARAGDANQLGMAVSVEVTVPAFMGDVAAPIFILPPGGAAGLIGMGPFLIQIQCATVGANIAWKVVPQNVSPDAIGTITTTGGWSTPASGTIQVWVPTMSRLAAQAVVSGVYSPVSILFIPYRRW